MIGLTDDDDDAENDRHNPISVARPLAVLLTYM